MSAEPTDSQGIVRVYMLLALKVFAHSFFHHFLYQHTTGVLVIIRWINEYKQNTGTLISLDATSNNVFVEITTALIDVGSELFLGLCANLLK